MTKAEEIADGLSELEHEWIIGWQGPAGAAFNAIAEGLYELGLLVSTTDWSLNEKGLAVKAALGKEK